MLTGCTYDSSVINLTYSEQLQLSHTMLPPGNRKWQLIYPNCLLLQSLLFHCRHNFWCSLVSKNFIELKAKIFWQHLWNIFLKFFYFFFFFTFHWKEVDIKDVRATHFCQFVTMEQHALKTVNNCLNNLNTNIYSY